MLGFSDFRLQLAINGDVRILVEAGVPFEAGFGLGSAFEDAEIVAEETEPPFERFDGVVVLEGMCPALRLFDEFAVGDTGGRPAGREMVCVQLEEAVAEARKAYNDAFFVFLALFDGVHRSPEVLDVIRRTKIVDAPFVGSGSRRKRLKTEAVICQTLYDQCF